MKTLVAFLNALPATTALLLAGSFALPANAATIAPIDVANQLMDFAERNYKQYMPSHRPTLLLPPYFYRFYPQTGIYLGVSDGKVYVLGGPWPEITYVAPVTDFITPTEGPAAATRASAAKSTAEANPDCKALGGFYWEVGEAGGSLASGEVINGGDRVGATSFMPVASASKWIYSSYIAEKRHGALSAGDIKFLTFRSGYTNFGLPICLKDETVADCLTHGTNGQYTAANDGLFFYDSGHMQQHASRPELGAVGGLDRVGLTAEVRGGLGGDIDITYMQPQLAGGVWTTASDYAVFLRKLLGSKLAMSALLGSNATCTNPLVCPKEAAHTPIPSNESWHYSIGHWIEDDPIVGDGSYSSLGTFGFYPWVDSSLRYYGILARNEVSGGVGSVRCGRQIRKAWLSATPQLTSGSQ